MLSVLSQHFAISAALIVSVYFGRSKDKSKQEEPSLLARIKVKGRDFDIDGKEAPEEELLQMSGLFKLKAVEGRIPIESKRLKYWCSSGGPCRKCFVKIPMGETRLLVFVDMEMLNAEFQAQWEKGQQSGR